MSQWIFNVRPGLGTTLVGLLIVSLFFYSLFKIAEFTIQTLISGLPIFFGLGLILLAAAFYVDENVPRRFFKRQLTTLKTNPFMGVLNLAAIVVFSPFVFGWLLVKALFIGKIRASVGEMQDRAAEEMRRNAGGGAPIGQDDEGFTEIKRDDGVVIRIPKSED